MLRHSGGFSESFFSKSFSYGLTSLRVAVAELRAIRTALVRHERRGRSGLRRKKGKKVKYTKVAAIAAGTLMAMGAAAPAFADAGAEGYAAHSGGVLSGNTVQAPIHIPVNACGNTVSVIGLLNGAFANPCTNA